jgi:hypothetical protein
MEPAVSNETHDGSGNSRFWRWMLIAVPVVPALGVGALFAIGALYHDCGEVQAWPRTHVSLAAYRLKKAAQLAGGRFPEEAGQVQRVLDPWDRPFRYERVGEDGRHARVFTLGKDGIPGGLGCSEDIVSWVELDE